MVTCFHLEQKDINRSCLLRSWTVQGEQEDMLSFGDGEAHFQPAFCVNMQECPTPQTLPGLTWGER